MKRFLAFIAILLIANGVAAGDFTHVFKAEGNEKHSLMGKLEFIDDPKGEFTIEQVATQKSGQFKLLDKTKKLAYDYQNQVLWLRVAIDTSKYNESLFFLTYDYDHIGNMRLYYPKAGGGFHMQEMDENLPKEGRNLKIREYVFQIATPEVKEPQYYYLRLAANTRLIKVDVSWSGINGLAQTVQDHAIGYGLFFGGMLVLLLYNLSLYAVLRDKAYLYYVYYVAGFTLTFLHVYGFTNYFFQLSPAGEALSAAFGFLTIQAMILFARHFLLLKDATPWIDRYLNLFQWIMGGGAVACFFMKVGHQFMYLNYLVLMVIPAIIAAGIKRWWQGYTPARFYTMGWAVFALALALLILRSVGILPTNIITNNAVMVASLWEAIIFSIALAYRIKLVEKEKNDILAQERSLLEARVEERTRELQKSLESRKLVIANASHELRTPVNTLSLLVDASSMNGQDRREMMTRVSQIAAHMSQLVENLLLIDADRPVSLTGGPTQEFDLGEEIRATCNMLGPTRRGSSASFSYNVDGCIDKKVKGDLVSLRRILINLLSNAFKFTNTGAVSIEAHSEVDIEKKTIHCVILVKDTGTGISAEMQERLFEPFVTNSLEHGHTGTGLGLPISRKLADNMGGSLQLVHSSSDNGTEFKCILPFAWVDRSSLPGKQHDNVGSVLVPLKKRLNVLIAEDDPIAAEAVQMIVRLLQHDVMHVGTYAELSNALTDKRHSFDVALVDHRLPGGNGLDMIKSCREMKIAPNTRMVLLTADATLDVLETARMVCDEVITKPTTAHRIRQLLGEGIPSSSDAIKNNIIDPMPIKALRANGAQLASLERIANMFYENTKKALTDLDSIGAPKSGDEIKVLADVIHRLRSSCATVGAAKLSLELQALVSCEDGDAFRLQLANSHEMLDMTMTSLCSLISKSEGK